MSFTGFPAEGLRFLTRLGSEDKAWFDANRNVYADDVVTPTKAFVSALGEALQRDVSPTLVAQPKTNGSIAPIHNDVRFSKNKAPYKDHLLLRFWDGDDKKRAPTLFVRLGEKSVGFASGVALGPIDRWRELVDDEVQGARLAAALAKLERGRKLDLAGRDLKKVPKPFSPDHPRASLLRHKGFQARWAEPTPAAVHSATFVGWCAKRLSACAPIHRWLLENRP